MPLPSEKQPAVRTLFVMMGVLIVVTSLLNYGFGLRLWRVRELNGHRRASISRMNQLLSTAKDAETGQRGYLLTGKDAYLEPYQAAIARIPGELEGMSRGTEDDLSEAELQSLSNSLAAKLKESAETMELRRRGEDAAAVERVRTDEGKKLMDSIRDLALRFTEREEAALQRGLQSADDANRYRTWIFALSGLASLGFLWWAYKQLSRTIGLREQALLAVQAAHDEILEQKEFVAVTLSSIGDCVIVTDCQSRITFMNGTAERVTGWSFGESKDRPLAEVFRILNEETRETVESPVEKVMRSGLVVGLANHTLLVRKDGTEVPIDDSGAPIRDGKGQIRGVVLVFRDFSEYKEAERNLKAAKEAAETANKAKDQFLAMLSHELRTPLSPVLATLNLWQASDELPPSMQEDVRMIHRNVELEARIIDDLLDLTRVAKGMLSFSPEDVDVHELIEFLLGLCQSEFQGKRLHVKTELRAARNYVHTDASRLQQVIWNVLRNAAKFTEAGGEIRVLTSNDPAGNLDVRVTDTGVGMSAATLAKLFTPFKQGEQELSRRYGGLGLGLAISRQLVDLLGGHISATSEGLGLGSSFTITFPALDRPPKATRTAAAASEGAAEKPNGSLRLLLVEDHVDSLLALTRLLRRRGYEVQGADTVAAAVTALAHQSFDVLISDLGLPDGSGYDIISRLRESSKMPAIALSGFGMEDDLARCQAAGFEAHLTKPVNFQKLEATIWHLVGKVGA